MGISGTGSAAMSTTSIQSAMARAGVFPGGSAIARGLEDGRAGEFARMLAQSEGAGGRGQEGPQATRRSAEQLVSVTFIQPMLRSMRESSQAAPPFAPTQVEKQFGPMLDARMADAMVRSSNWAIVDRIERDLLRAGGQRSEPGAAQQGAGEQGAGDGDA